MHPLILLPLLLPPDPPTPAAAVDQARLLDTIRALPLKRSGWKDPEHRAGLRQAEGLIQSRLKDLGYTPVLHEIGAFTGRGETPPGPPADGAAPAPGNEDTARRAVPPTIWHNILADIPGKTAPSEVIIIAAHFDAVPFCPGADDNGTGAAALLEIARVLKDAPMHRTVRLAFFNLEETQPIGMGLIGSGAYAADLAKEIEAGTITIAGVISMDTIGYYSDEPDSQSWPKLPVKIPMPTTGDFIAVGGLMQHQPFSQPFIKAMRAAAPDLKVFGGDILPIAPPDFLRSDHAPFLAMGIPAIIVSDTANFRSPHYHRKTDTLDTIDVTRYTLTVRAVAGGVYEVAGPMNGSASSPPPRPPRAEPKPADPIPAPLPAPRPAPGRDGGLGPQPGQGPEQPR